MRGLYAITPETPDTVRLLEQVRSAIAGGAAVVQYRSKRVTRDIIRIQAEALRELTRATGTLFIVNDDSDLALSVLADGVHLGRDDGDALSIFRIRQQCAMRIGQNPAQPFMIGVSCYNELPRAEAAVAAGADYVAFGSFFSSATKPFALRADVALIQAARNRLNVPIVAIGGITVDNAQQLISAGADMVAVITSLFDANDIEHRASEFTGLFEQGNHVCQ